MKPVDLVAGFKCQILPDGFYLMAFTDGFHLTASFPLIGSKG